MKRVMKKLLAVFLLVCLIVPLGRGLEVEAAVKYFIKINKGTNVVTVYDGKTGEPYVAFTCSVGYGDNTPVGEYALKEKYLWHELMGPSYGQYCTRIVGGVLFHPVWYYVNGDKSTQSTAQYNKLGQTASHGCVRLTAAASIWIYDNCPYGTPVTIFQGTEQDDPLGKPETIQVSTATRSGWDPTDPDPNNPYETRSTKPVITVSSKVVAFGSKFNHNNMTAVDSGGFDCTSWVKASGTVNTHKPGSYKVTYSVIDSFGRTAEKTVTYVVKEPKAPTLTGVKADLTKEYLSTRNMLVGLKAKNYLGKNITSKIKVYVMKPGKNTYSKLADTDYRFTSTGKYKIKYTVKDSVSGLSATKTATIRVVDSKAPKHYSDSDWEDYTFDISKKTISFNELVGDEQALLRCGEDRTKYLTVRISDEDGNSVDIKKGESFAVTAPGTYEIEYAASSAIPNLKTGEYEYSYEYRIMYITEFSPEDENTQIESVIL